MHYIAARYSVIISYLCMTNQGNNYYLKFSSCLLLLKVICWNLSTLQSEWSLPTLGGFVYSIAPSPLDPARLALGVGDNMIRVWNTGARGKTYDVITLWQGIKSKVTVVRIRFFLLFFPFFISFISSLYCIYWYHHPTTTHPTHRFACNIYIYMFLYVFIV